jgi:hypothetical protein
MQKIFKTKKGKDFYRDQLEYMEYDPTNFESDKMKYLHLKDREEDDVIGFRISKKFKSAKP